MDKPLDKDFRVYLVTTPSTGVVKIVGKECFDASGNVIPNTEINKFKPAFEVEKNKNDKKVVIKEDMHKLLAGMTLPEMFGLFFHYMSVKTGVAGSNDDPSDAIPPITPTGEDIVVWGDKLGSALIDKLAELRSI